MIGRLRDAWQTRPWLTAAFVLACLVTTGFAVRFTVQAVYWATHQDTPVQPWMTVGYIARSWGLDGRDIDARAGLPLPEVKGRPQPLSEIARDRGVPVEDIIARVEAAIRDLRADEGTDPGADSGE
ncbi:MAG: hypothetical protein NTW20_11035 [Rhodobacterales bacterium]|nr:hypothetical protein [Rhodobacterales bacterium]